jgi:hypothetical protein
MGNFAGKHFWFQSFHSYFRRQSALYGTTEPRRKPEVSILQKNETIVSSEMPLHEPMLECTLPS